MSTVETRPLTAAASLVAVLMTVVAIWYGTRSYEGAAIKSVDTLFEPQEPSAAASSYKTLFGRIPVELPTPEYVASLKPADRAALHAEVMGRVSGLPPWVVSDSPPGNGGVAPEPVATGVFEIPDAAHTGEGRVTVLQLADGSAVLRLEDFRVMNGPDLQVRISTSGGAGEGSVALGRLKGNIGNQNYPLPATVAPGTIQGVEVYCGLFSDTYLAATLR